MMQDEKVRETLVEIKDVFAEIEDRELCLYAEGYEDYSSGYWSSDWVWEYEDRKGIRGIIENAASFAHECLNDCRYEEALSVFKLVMDTQIPVEDECGGDSFELNLEEMKDERLVGINLQVIALDVL